jgi:DNA-binding NtrC family response regulator
VPTGTGGAVSAPPGGGSSEAYPPGETIEDAGDSGAAGEVPVEEGARLDLSGPRSPGGHAFRLPPSGVVLEDVEQDFLRQALEATQGNQTKAAEMLGLTRDALRYRMKKFGLL